jgi:Zn-finger nucleic acid-binding protein
MVIPSRDKFFPVKIKETHSIEHETCPVCLGILLPCSEVENITDILNFNESEQVTSFSSTNHYHLA